MIKSIIKKNCYYDSVSLMLLTKELKVIPEITDCNVCMGTPHNLEILTNTALLTSEMQNVTPNDLIISLKGTETAINKALEVVEKNLTQKKQTIQAKSSYRNLSIAMAENPSANMVIISVPGAYAAQEARTALIHHKHVMLFSDNVSIEEEKQLKTLAIEKGLLLMGPDCGTAIINSVPLCFANKVKKGNIGIIGASGTGIQEVSTLIDRFGYGISQAIGTGGRDLTRDIGGMMMLFALENLALDNETSVIVLVSKPPYPDVAEKLVKKARTLDKAVIICFLGLEREDTGNVQFTSTLDLAAIKACKAIARKNDAGFPQCGEPAMVDLDFVPTQKYLRGLYTGGTLCDEAMYIASKEIHDLYSNMPFGKCHHLEDPEKSVKNTFIDLGDDYFTRGCPHPMIDPEKRNQRILQEAQDPEVAVILLDFVLGYGAHPDPVGVTLPFIRQAKETNPHISFIAPVTGTDNDPQNLKKQTEILVQEGITLASCNAQAALLTTCIVEELNKCVH